MTGLKQKYAISIVSLVILCLLVGCHSLAQYYTSDGAEGVARYYAKRYHGRKTTSGEIYDSKKMTAAHPSLPLGTRVKVVNLDNKKSVIVKINDRCDEHENVFIDLSRQAARKIGMIKKGKANVRITIVD